MLSQKWDVSRFWDTNPPFNGRRGENGDDGSSDLAADSPELRSSRTGFRPDASNCGQTILVRNRTRSVAKKKELFETGRVQLRRSEPASKRGSSNCEGKTFVRNRVGPVTQKWNIFVTGGVQLRRKRTCLKQGASSCEEVTHVRNGTLSIATR